jgi:hypothetical protein
MHPDLVNRNPKAPDQIQLELDRAQRHARETLQALPAGSRWPAYMLYAAAPAERLFRWYDERPGDERCPYSLLGVPNWPCIVLELAARTYHTMSQMASQLLNKPVAQLWPVPEGEAQEAKCEWLIRPPPVVKAD